jgi:hypothetical protein
LVYDFFTEGPAVLVVSETLGLGIVFFRAALLVHYRNHHGIFVVGLFYTVAVVTVWVV